MAMSLIEEVGGLLIHSLGADDAGRFFLANGSGDQFGGGGSLNWKRLDLYYRVYTGPALT